MGLIIDLVNDAQVVSGLRASGVTVTTQGASVDLSNCEIATNAILNIGITTSVTTAIVRIEESTDGVNNWTAISGMAFNAVTLTSAAGNVLQVTRGLRSQRYARVNVVTLTAHTEAPFALNVNFIAQKKHSPDGASGASQYPSS